MNRGVLFAVVILFSLIAGTASAATVDPELLEIARAKSRGDLVDVIMFMDDPLQLEALDRSLEGASPQLRRETVVRALREHAVRSQARALDVIDDSASMGKARAVRRLWLANAIAFQADLTTLEALALSSSPGTVVEDKPYDMISGVVARDHASRVAEAQGVVSTADDGARLKQTNAWGVNWVNAPAAWGAGYDGSGVLVAHFDTGVWLTHPDIVNQLWVNPGEIAGNSIDDDNNGYVDDVNGWDFANQDSNPNDDVVGVGANHGTHTAGTVAGDGTNGTATGVAPGASIMVCKSSLSDGSGAPFSAIFEGQQYAIEMGARVFTMSLGIAGSIPASFMRAERQNGDAIRAAGVAFFNSAGNDHNNFNPPEEIGLTARVPSPWNSDPSVPYSERGGVIAVGGTAYKSNSAYSASSQGPVDWGEVSPYFDWNYPEDGGLIKPDVAAPGVGINSLQKPAGYSGDTWSGTSMSCPHAAGVAALILDKNPSLSPEDVDRILEQSALDLGVAGKDNVFGAGQLDALVAVNLTPTLLLPHVVLSKVTVQDASGDGVIDPGESFDLLVELTNNSQVIDATNVAVTTTVVANPYVSVTDGSATFASLLQDGGSASNSSDALSLTAAGGAPQGFVFDVVFDIVADGPYARSIDHALFVGLPEYNEHDVGAVHLTVTDQGIVGYMDDAQSFGGGFGPIDGGSALFVGSFWGGTGQTYVCNRDYSSSETLEWQVTTTPNGRVRTPSIELSDQDYLSTFSDAGHASPKGITVTQHSMAWATAPNDDFIIVKYIIRNDGGATVSDYHAGIFCDWDIGNSSANLAGTDNGRKMSYVYETGGSYYGVSLLGGAPLANVSVVNNPTYVYPLAHIDDGIKGRLLKGTIAFPTGATADDWSAVTSAGPMSLAPGAVEQVAFAIIRGESLADLNANADAAAALYPGLPTPVEDGPGPRRFALEQNVPNPFNPSTTIHFDVRAAGTVRIDVFDLSGRKVRSLVDRSFEPGRHAAIWNGTDDGGRAVASGMYLYRYAAEGRSLTRKMMLVK